MNSINYIITFMINGNQIFLYKELNKKMLIKKTK